jgi:hypothetical protein
VLLERHRTEHIVVLGRDPCNEVAAGLVVGVMLGRREERAELARPSPERLASPRDDGIAGAVQGSVATNERLRSVAGLVAGTEGAAEEAEPGATGTGGPCP